LKASKALRVTDQRCGRTGTAKEWGKKGAAKGRKRDDPNRIWPKEKKTTNKNYLDC